MKKILFLLLSGFTISTVHTQEVVSGLRFAQDNITGTARFQAMSGAFGALGGDFSSLNVNPAGSAVFNYNQLGFTFSNIDNKKESDYYGTITNDRKSNFDLNQAGGVFVFINRNPKAEWTKFSLAVNYENTNNFDNSIKSIGFNPTNSVDQYFLFYANANQYQTGMPLGEIKNNDYFSLNFADQQAFLGYEGYIINPVSDTPDNTEYVSNVTDQGRYYHENFITSQGYNGKLSFNAATSYKDQIYLGLTLNSHFTDFRQNTYFFEENYEDNNNVVDIRSTSFENEIYTYGSGFSFQLGAIAKLTNEFRLGLSYQSPTWNKLNDELKQTLYSNIYNYENTDNPDLTTAHPDTDGIIAYQEYKLRTPGKITGSMAIVFNKKGLLSADIGYKNYGNIEYSIENDSRNPIVNSEISNQLKGAADIRIGGEYKIERLSLRGGYRYEASPYKDKSYMGDLKGFSTGLGYNFGATKADLSYAYSKRNSNQGFFSHGFTDGANTNNINNTVIFTLLFDL